MDAIILAGGLGTRLAQTVPHLPKVLAPIQGVPFILLLLQQLERSLLFSRVILALGHKSLDIQKTLQPEKFSFSLEYSIETSPLGTGGALLKALEKVESDLFLAMNGDSYLDLSFSSFIYFHKIKEASLSIACLEVEDASRYGSIEMDPSQRIVSFSEKSAISQKGYISAGIYLMQKSLLDHLPVTACSIEKDLFPSFLEKRVFGYPCSATFIDIGTKDSYLDAQETLKQWT